jgi:hypothetical protein
MKDQKNHPREGDLYLLKRRNIQVKEEALAIKLERSKIMMINIIQLTQ